MKFRLLQARQPGDPVRSEERRAFASRLDVRPSAIVSYDLLTEPIHVDAVTDGVDVVLVGGSGAYSVFHDEVWLPPFIRTMGGLAERGFPTFASCFGFQALVVALGGEVATDEHASEVGSFEVHRVPAAADDPLFRHLPQAFVVQQGHKDRAFTLPPGVVNLVASERCPFQALRVADKPVYATQFHAELTGNENRTRFERYFDMYSAAFGSSHARRMLDDFRPSPEANDLLRRFRLLLADGTLS